MLAAQIDRIVHPKENVIPISRSEVPAGSLAMSALLQKAAELLRGLLADENRS